MLEIKHKEKIKLIATDFDGILTDGGLYLSCDSSESFKKVNYKDIMGISLWIKSGKKLAIISGDSSEAINTLAKKFNLEDVHQGLKFEQKSETLQKIMNKYSLCADEICYIGDDINDITALKLAKTAITVPDANYKLKEQIDDIIITDTKGGFGALREVVDSILH